MGLPIDRLAAFDDKLHPRDGKGRFRDKPGLPDVPTGGFFEKDGKTDVPTKPKPRKKKERNPDRPVPPRDPLPDPKPIIRSSRKQRIKTTEQELQSEIDKVNKEYGFDRGKGSVWEQAIEAITKLGAMIAEHAPKALRELEVEAIKSIKTILSLDLDAKDYYDIPDAALEYLHYAMEHSDLIHHAVSSNPFTETEIEEIQMFEPTDEILALFREKDHPRDRKGRFAELGAALKKAVESIKGASSSDDGDHSEAKQTLEKAGIPPAPVKNGTVRRLQADNREVYDVYVDPVSGAEARDHPDGSTTVNRGGKENIGARETIHPRLGDRPAPSKFGKDEVHIPKPTPDNTKLHVGFPVKAEVGYQTVTKREDGVWESSHGPVGPEFAKALDILLSKEEKVAQAENKLDKDATLPKTTDASKAKPTPTAGLPKRRLGFPVGQKDPSGTKRKFGLPVGNADAGDEDVRAAAKRAADVLID